MLKDVTLLAHIQQHPLNYRALCSLCATYQCNSNFTTAPAFWGVFMWFGCSHVYVHVPMWGGRVGEVLTRSYYNKIINASDLIS